jgi:cytochrome c-type biogenesis protein
MAEKRIHLRSRPAGYAGSLLIGATFAAGWTPCVGQVLGMMLLYAGTTETLMDGVTLLALYSFGLGFPLFMAAMGVNRFLASFKQVRAYLRLISVSSGVALAMSGVLIYSDRLANLTSIFERYGIGSYLGTDG